MLWRLHLLGIDLGERPSAIADHFAKVLEDREYSFNDAHAAMALVAAGRLEEAQRLLALAEERAEAAADTHARMLKAAGLPVLRGLAAFGAGDYGAAADHLAPVRERLAAFGGSHAQRDVFQLTLLEALSRAGRHEEAEAVAAARTADKPQGGLNWRMRAQVAERAGKADAAAKARERAAAIAAG
jgi:tetratricopeptide (TPR) repeat protein